MTSEEFGQDLEHVEVLQKKFDEFQKVTLSVLSSSDVSCQISCIFFSTCHIHWCFISLF